MGYIETGAGLGALILAIATFLAVLIGLPLALIWSVNTLGIATASYGLTEWLAAFLLTALLLGGSASYSTGKKGS